SLHAPPPPDTYTLSLHDALPILRDPQKVADDVRDGYVTEEVARKTYGVVLNDGQVDEDATQQIRNEIRRNRLGQDLAREVLAARSEEHTSELQSRENLVCRLLLE